MRLDFVLLIGGLILGACTQPAPPPPPRPVPPTAGARV